MLAGTSLLKFAAGAYAVFRHCFAPSFMNVRKQPIRPVPAYGHAPPPAFYVIDTYKGILVNGQIFSELQNVLSCIMKQAVLAAETGHIAAPNKPYCSAKRAVRLCDMRIRGSWGAVGSLALAAHWQAWAGCGIHINYIVSVWLRCFQAMHQSVFLRLTVFLGFREGCLC